MSDVGRVERGRQFESSLHTATLTMIVAGSTGVRAAVD